MDPDGGSPIKFPMDPPMPRSLGTHFLSHIASFIDSSRFLYGSGSVVLDEAFSCASKFAGGLLIWFARGLNSNNIGHRNQNSSFSNGRSNTQLTSIIRGGPKSIGAFGNGIANGNFCIPLGKISWFSMKQLCAEAHQLFSFSSLVLAAAMVPPFNNVCPVVMAVPVETAELETQRCLSQRPCDVQHHRGSSFSLQGLSWTGHAVEPRTGIEFPTVLENIVAENNNNSSFSSEVLVGTGSRIMRIIRIKSLKVYAFGFYIHPFDVCEKLGPKYASLPVRELNKSPEFYEDLLREDINMTVRLVVSCNGIKFNTVKEAFEKSLRARLVKKNPDTDFSCLQSFGSIFSNNIPLHVGTTISFRRTADGCFITKIGESQLGVVQSKELCRAFFDMYVGDLPVCEQTKEQIGKNVASIMTRC